MHDAREQSDVRVGELREMLAALQRDASTMEEELSGLAAECRKAEADAMAAVERGNDAVARECLARHDRLTEARAVIEAQLPRQLAFIATCRELLGNITTSEDG